jgi:ribose transport system substrate-binding protein
MRDGMAMKFRLSAVVSLLCLSGASLAFGGEGLTTPVRLPAYDPARSSCRAPVGLQRKLVFVQDNRREFMQGAGRGLEAAARARSLRYGVAFANNDPALMIKQVGDIATDKTGAIVVAPIDPPSLAPALKKVIGGGAYVGAIVPPPATTVLNAPQYLTGKVLAEAAANYIRTRLGGRPRLCC